MMRKTVTITVVGYGNRATKYAGWIKSHPDKARIVAVADSNPVRLEMAARELGLSSEAMFKDPHSVTKIKRSDAILITTPDASHFDFAIEAAEAGYQLFVEKPLAAEYDECEGILDAAVKNGVLVMTGFVLRYHPYYRKLKEIIDSGVLGRIFSIHHSIDIGKDRMTHTFVRGLWGKTSMTTPLFVSKCCHDVDLLFWMTGIKVRNISSFGALTFYKKENAPFGSAEKCVDCSIEKSCPYSAIDLYICRDRWNNNFDIPDGCSKLEAIEKAVKDGPFSRCVFHCGNDAVDHQVALFIGNGGEQITLTVNGIRRDSGRRTIICGSAAEIIADGKTIVIRYTDGTPQDRIDLSDELNVPGHSGADDLLMEEFIGRVSGHSVGLDDFVTCVNSHKLCFLAEESRLNNKTITI